MDNHSIYANEEIESWVDRSGLIEQEKYLVSKYLQNKGKLIEAGTGGGRISLEIKKEYDKLEIMAFDFVKEMIENAKIKSDKISFEVADASDLSFIEDESFDFAVYLQQIVSLVPYSLMSLVLSESFRILKKDGLIIFSFLYFDGRAINPFLSSLINTIRVIRGEKYQQGSLPWLKLSGKPNYKLFGKNQAMTYWFKKEEILEILKKTGFKIIEVTTSKEILKHLSGADGMLYIVCKK